MPEAADNGSRIEQDIADAKAARKNEGPADTSERPVDDVNDDHPYENRGTAQEAGEPPGAEEFENGDRGELSGRNQEQLEQARTRPEERR
jgi:hypothetical protein